jgi:cyclic pyranopterin phosphate synthase
MKDRTGRNIDYLRISVTDRCNCRCFYCLPEEGVPLKSHRDILSFEEIYEVAKYGVSRGIVKIKLTGGEPLLRRNFAHLVELLASIEGLKDIGMTTNATLLAPVARELKAAGLQRVNISLDTLNPGKYKEITRCGNITDALAGIDAALEAGLSPVKLNVVKIPGKNEDEWAGLKEFADSKGIGIRYIPLMDLQNGVRTIVEGGTGGQCNICNRLRLSADGMLRPCLFSDIEYGVREHGIEKAFELALSNKPDEGDHTENRKMIQIGG